MTHARLTESIPPRSKLRVALWLTASGLLLLPLVAMQFTREVYWTASDFAFAAAMLFGSLGVFELLTRGNISHKPRAAIGAMLLGAFLLAWINAAVGIIGSEHNPVNLIFFALAGTAVAGAFLLSFTAPRR